MILSFVLNSSELAPLGGWGSGGSKIPLFGWYFKGKIVKVGPKGPQISIFWQNLLKKWEPKVSGVMEKLQGGGSYADIGCGFGISTLMVAEAFPDAKVYGFDIHEPSISKAKSLAEESGLSDRINYQVADAKSYNGYFDVIAFFDCLHDMGDPEGAARYA